MMNRMQSLIDIKIPHHTAEGPRQAIQRDPIYQIIYVHNRDEQVTVVEALTIQLKHVLAWLQLGNSIFITQKRPDEE
jgi:hypothetical protein